MVFKALQKVFVKPKYALLACSTSLVVFALAVWLPNISLIVRVMDHSGISFLQKLDLPISLLGSITTNFSLLSGTYTIAISLLFGINLAMIVYFMRRRVTEIKQDGATIGFFGIASGIFGMGCAACGSFLLMSALSLFGASSILAFLPLGGAEFGLLGVALLTLSIRAVSRQVQNPEVCRINS